MPQKIPRSGAEPQRPRSRCCDDAIVDSLRASSGLRTRSVPHPSYASPGTSLGTPTPIRDNHATKARVGTKDLFRGWSERDLSAERYAILLLDGFHLKVRMARRVVSVPVLAVMGVAEDGSKRLVALTLAASEAGAHWSSLVADLQRRGLEAPVLILSDGHAGLRKAIELWPTAQVQRCTWHKWQNLVGHCPVHARRELKRDYDRIVYAKDAMAAREAHASFLTKWGTLCPAVARSLEEAGEPLLTFTAFPKPMWRALRTTNSLENLNREFRRRTKTQASFSTEDAGVTLLFGLVAFGQIKLRKIDGHDHVAKLLTPAVASAA